MLVPSRHGSSESYRYGFQGQEKDDELKGEGNSYDFGARMLDPRIGRWGSIDPRWRELESLSPYNFSANNPIKFIDSEGEIPIDPLVLLFKAIPWIRDNFTSRNFALKITDSKDISLKKKKEIMYNVGLYDGILSTIDLEDMIQGEQENLKEWLSSKPFELTIFKHKTPDEIERTVLGSQGIGLKKQAEQIISIISNWDKLDNYTKGQVHGQILGTLIQIGAAKASKFKISELKLDLIKKYRVKFYTGKLYSGIPLPEFIPIANKYINQAIKNIVKGDGIPRVNPDGSQKIYRNNEGFSGKNNREFTGALEWEAQGPSGTHYRVLEKTTINPDGTTTTTYGYSTDVNYRNIHKFTPKNP